MLTVRSEESKETTFLNLRSSGFKVEMCENMVLMRECFNLKNKKQKNSKLIRKLPMQHFSNFTKYMYGSSSPLRKALLFVKHFCVLSVSCSATAFSKGDTL